MSHIQGEIENSGLDELEDDIEKATILAGPIGEKFQLCGSRWGSVLPGKFRDEACGDDRNHAGAYQRNGFAS